MYQVQSIFVNQNQWVQYQRQSDNRYVCRSSDMDDEHTYHSLEPDEQPLTFALGGQKQVFYAAKNMLQTYYREKAGQDDMSSDRICEYFLVNGPWKITLSHLRRQILTIDKDEW